MADFKSSKSLAAAAFPCPTRVYHCKYSHTAECAARQRVQSLSEPTAWGGVVRAGAPTVAAPLRLNDRSRGVLACQAAARKDTAGHSLDDGGRSMPSAGQPRRVRAPRRLDAGCRPGLGDKGAAEGRAPEGGLDAHGGHHLKRQGTLGERLNEDRLKKGRLY